MRQRFDELITEAEELIPVIERENEAYHAQDWNRSVVIAGEVHNQSENIYSITTRVVTLIELVLGKNDRGQKLIQRIEATSGSSCMRLIRGTLRGLKEDYERGLLDALPHLIEANVISDYMGQAEQLLGEGVAGQYDYVPAAVLAGAVLENALRTLCQRQSPPIDVTKPNGSPKTLDPLIADLQRVNVFNTAKAHQLRAWAKIRNYAAHGEFTEFKRSEVEAMITGIQNFIADYL